MDINKQINDLLRDFREVCFKVRDNKPEIDGLVEGIEEAKAKIQSLITRAELESAQQATRANNDLHRLHERNIDEVVTRAVIDELVRLDDKVWLTVVDVQGILDRRIQELEATLPVDELLEGNSPS